MTGSTDGQRTAATFLRESQIRLLICDWIESADLCPSIASQEPKVTEGYVNELKNVSETKTYIT
jgi:hypothetical protein